MSAESADAAPLESVRVLLRAPTDWPTLGWEVADFIEAYLPHGPGDVEGDPFLLDDEQLQWLCDVYRLYPVDHPRAGRRVIHEAVISRLKGRAKSEIAGAICVVEALGPCRFDGWNAGGDPVGRPIRRPFIRCLATEEEQSGNTYDNVTFMLDHAAEHDPGIFGGIDVGRDAQTSTRTYLPGGGEIRPSTGSAAAKDGGKETFSVADEPHLYVLPVHKGMHSTVRRNTRKRKAADPWMLNTTTAFAPGAGSVAEELHTDAEKQIKLEAKGKKRNLTFFYDHRQAPPLDADEWDDDDAVRVRLELAADVFAPVLDIDGIIETEFRGPRADPTEAKRYWFNQIDQAVEHAFDIIKWRKPVADGGLWVPEYDPDEEPVTWGFDGARFHDATALIETGIRSGTQTVVGMWELDPANPDAEVSIDDVDQVAIERWELADVFWAYCDPPYWEELIDRWIARWGENRIVKWWTNRYRQMAFAVQAYSTAQRSGEVTHDGNPDLARHIGNARKRDTTVKDDNGKRLWTVQKEHPLSPKKIDGAVAGTLSWEARGDAIAAGALKPKRKARGHTF